MLRLKDNPRRIYRAKHLPLQNLTYGDTGFYSGQTSYLSMKVLTFAKSEKIKTTADLSTCIQVTHVQVTVFFSLGVQLCWKKKSKSALVILSALVHIWPSPEKTWESSSQNRTMYICFISVSSKGTAERARKSAFPTDFCKSEVQSSLSTCNSWR